MAQIDERNPTAAIMIIGDEILSGRTLDSNVGTIARFLTSLGIDLKEVRMIGDEEDVIVQNLNALRPQYDYIFTTGGIGPTHDDITADAVAKAFGVDISEHPEARRVLEVRAARLNAPLNANTLRMARIPHGASMIKNPISAAPGIHIGNVFVMAGVPKIMEAMLEDVAQRLKTGQKVHARTLRLRYIGESWAADILRELAQANEQLSLGSYPYGLYNAGEFGTQLVVRGRDQVALDAAFSRLQNGLQPVLENALLRYPEAEISELTSEES